MTTSAVVRPSSDVGPVERSVRFVRIRSFVPCDLSIPFVDPMIAYMVGGSQLDINPYSTGIVAIFAYDRLCGINIRLGRLSATRSNVINLHIVPDSEPCDNVVDDPSWVVSRQPSEYRGLVNQIVGGGCWRCLETLLRKTTNSVPCIVRTDIIDCGINHLHLDKS